MNHGNGEPVLRIAPEGDVTVHEQDVRPTRHMVETSYAFGARVPNTPVVSPPSIWSHMIGISLCAMALAAGLLIVGNHEALDAFLEAEDRVAVGIALPHARLAVPGVSLQCLIPLVFRPLRAEECNTAHYIVGAQYKKLPRHTKCEKRSAIRAPGQIGRSSR